MSETEMSSATPNPLFPTGTFESALIYASQGHAGQVRKGTRIPYISHPLAVAALVMEVQGSEDEVVAALLHDLVEDAGGEVRLADIRLRFGNKVADIVEGCSDTCSDDLGPKPLWAERKRRHLENLEDESESVLIVTTADKLHNVRSIVRDYEVLDEQIWPRFRGGREGTLWYYRQVTEIVTRKAHGSWAPMARELAEMVAYLERLCRDTEIPGLSPI